MGGIMKAFIAGSALLFAVSGTSALAKGEEVLTIENRTGYTIAEVYLAPATSDNWEEDLLGKDTLETNTSFDVDMSSSADTCKWDLRAVYDDKSAAKWRNIDLCKISSITLFYNAKTDVTSAKYK
jgi:hypothetical protein